MRNYPFAGVVPISAKDKRELYLRFLRLSGKSHQRKVHGYFQQRIWCLDQTRPSYAISDIVREKILLATRDEIPHAIAVDVDEMKTRDRRYYLYPRYYLSCERDSQKGIIIGKKGAFVARATTGAEARADIFKSNSWLQRWYFRLLGS
ncbi:MAG: KH domain-containing protein [Veillonella sp.]